MSVFALLLSGGVRIADSFWKMTKYSASHTITYFENYDFPAVVRVQIVIVAFLQEMFQLHSAPEIKFNQDK